MMDTQQRVQLLLQYAQRDHIAAETLIDWACEEMVAGVDTPHLRRLAGYLRANTAWRRNEIERDFLLSMRELGFQRKIPQEYNWREYLCFFLGLYEDGHISTREAASLISRIEMESQSSPSVFLADDPCVAIYIEVSTLSEDWFLAVDCGQSFRVLNGSDKWQPGEILDSESIEAYARTRLHQASAVCCPADAAAKTT